MFRDLLLLLVLADLDILLFLLMIILVIVGYFLWNLILKFYQYTATLQKWLKPNSPNVSKPFRSDNALEYTQYVFQALLHSYGTVHHQTCPGTSQQNTWAKRKLCHILDTVCALILSAKVPAPFWGEAVLHAVHAINCIPSTVIHNQASYERLFGSPPDYHHFHSFRSACFVLLQPQEHNKLEP